MISFIYKGGYLCTIEYRFENAFYRSISENAENRVLLLCNKVEDDGAGVRTHILRRQSVGHGNAKRSITITAHSLSTDTVNCYSWQGETQLRSRLKVGRSACVCVTSTIVQNNIREVCYLEAPGKLDDTWSSITSLVQSADCFTGHVVTAIAQTTIPARAIFTSWHGRCVGLPHCRYGG